MVYSLFRTSSDGRIQSTCILADREVSGNSHENQEIKHLYETFIRGTYGVKWRNYFYASYHAEARI